MTHLTTAPPPRRRRADRRPRPVRWLATARWPCSRCSPPTCRSRWSSVPRSPPHGAPLAGWAGSWLIFGGSAHLAAIRTLDQAGAVAAILTGLLINARLLVYSASLARRWRGQPRWFRVAAAGLIIDPTWAAAERHAGRLHRPRRAASLLPRGRAHARRRMVGGDRRRRGDRRPPRLARPRDRHPAVPARTGRRRDFAAPAHDR